MEKKFEYFDQMSHPNEIRAVNDFMGKYQKLYEIIKVGISGRNPQVRFDEHLRKDSSWERMIVVFKTKSEIDANKIEKYCMLVYPDLVNKWDGFSDLHDSGYNYVYFLLKDKVISYKMGIDIGDKMK